MEHSNPKTQRAIELYNDVQEKKESFEGRKESLHGSPLVYSQRKEGKSFTGM